MPGISASDVNAQIPLSAQPPQFDPLATVGKLNQVQQGLIQNRILSQQAGEKVAAGQAISAAIDPATGLPDAAKVGQFFIDHPELQQYAPAAVQAAQTLHTAQLGNQGQGLANQKADLELSAQRWDVASGTLDSLLSDKTPITPDRFIGAARDIIQRGHFNDPNSQAQIVQAVQNMPPMTGDAAADERAMRQYVQNLSVQARNTQEHINMLLGQTGNVDTGGRIVTARTGGIGPNGGVDVVGGFDKSLSPESAAELVQVIGPDKKPYFVPKGSLVGDGAPSGGGGGGNGRYPAANPGAPAGAVAQAGFAPGDATTMEDSAKTFLADNGAVPDLRRTLTAFDQAYDTIRKAKTGPGSEAMQNLRGVADTYGLKLPVLTNKTETEAYAEANKWLTTALTTEAARLGLGTDAARKMASDAQPGVHTVHGAAVAMIPVLKGLKAMEVAAPLLAQAQGVTPQNYVEWRAKWANSVDPRAFGADLMPAADRKAIIAKMSDEQKRRYAAGLRSAISAGLFTADDLGK